MALIIAEHDVTRHIVRGSLEMTRGIERRDMLEFTLYNCEMPAIGVPVSLDGGRGVKFDGILDEVRVFEGNSGTEFKCFCLSPREDISERSEAEVILAQLGAFIFGLVSGDSKR